MPHIQFQQEIYALQEGESVLQALLRNGIQIPNGCRAGACQSCVMVADEGTIPPQAQAGLKAAQKQLGYFLSCQCVPADSLQIRLAEHLQQAEPAQVLSVDMLSASVLRLRLAPVLDYLPGQYLNIWHNLPARETPLIRSYSIASVPAIDSFIELHIKIITNGQFSAWAQRELKHGDYVQIQGPVGQCVYSAQHLEQPLLLTGIGTGLAPLYGIARQALHQGHLGEIHLILGAQTSAGFYLQNELAQLTEQFANFHVHYLSQNIADNTHKIQQANIYEFVKTEFASTKGFGIYVCGAASFVRKMKKQCFLAGAAMSDIYADAFLPCS